VGAQEPKLTNLLQSGLKEWQWIGSELSIKVCC
jgi:hypothetical protein